MTTPERRPAVPPVDPAQVDGPRIDPQSGDQYWPRTGVIGLVETGPIPKRPEPPKGGGA